MLSAVARAHPLSAGGRQLGRLNNFDALRLLAALSVLVSHAFALTGAEQPKIGAFNLGTVGVYVFFAISGFLIAQSWLIDPHLWRYLAKRALRILPALFLVLLLSVFVLGPVFTTASLADYFTSSQTWRYLTKNSIFALEHELPGVFVDNPDPREVNGPLWTLGPEVWAYLLLAALGLVGALRRKWVAPVVAMALIAWPHEPTDVIPWPHQIFLLQMFAVGMSLYVLRSHIPWHGGIAAVLVGAFVLAPVEAAQVKLAVIAIPYATIWVAYRGPSVLRRLTTRGDFSYGLYLYAWPVGQAVAALVANAGPLLMIALSLPVTFALAIASWHLVEKPSLAFKKSLKGRSAEPRVDEPPGSVPAVSLDDNGSKLKHRREDVSFLLVKKGAAMSESHGADPVTDPAGAGGQGGQESGQGDAQGGGGQGDVDQGSGQRGGQRGGPGGGQGHGGQGGG